MVNQFDILTQIQNTNKSKEQNGMYVVVSNNVVNNNSPYIWAFPVTQREHIYVTDIPLITKTNDLKGVIDSGKIVHIDIDKEPLETLSKVQPRIQKMLIESIQAHTEIVWVTQGVMLYER